MAAGQFSQRVRVGAMIERSFSTWASNARGFIGVTVLFNLPMLIINIGLIVTMEGYAVALLGKEPIDSEFTLVNSLQLILGLVSFLISMIVTGAICHAAFQHLRGEQPDMKVSTRRGLSRMFVLVLTSLLGGLISVAVLFVAAIPMVVLTLGIGPMGGVIGGLIIGVAVMYLMVSFYAAIPAAAVETLSPMEAVKRSWNLVKDRRLTMFGTIVVLGLIVGIPMALVSALLYGMLGAVVTAIISQFIGLVFASLVSASQAVIYHDLRVDKEGLGDDDLVNVFA